MVSAFEGMHTSLAYGILPYQSRGFRNECVTMHLCELCQFRNVFSSNSMQTPLLELRPSAGSADRRNRRTRGRTKGLQVMFKI